MRKIIIAIALGLILLLSSVVFAETTESVSLEGSKTGELYTSAVTVKYHFDNPDGIKTVQLLVGNKVVSEKDYTCDSAGIPLEDPLQTVEDSQIITADFLVQNEPTGYVYNLKVRYITGSGTAIDKDQPFKADLSIPKISISGIDDQGAYNENKTVKVTLKDKNPDNAKLSVIVKKNGKEIVNQDNIADEFTYESKGEGTYEIITTGIDKAEHRVAESRTFTIDNTPPSINSVKVSGHKKSDRLWFDDSVIITGQIEDNFNLQSVSLKNGDKVIFTQKDINNVRFKLDTADLLNKEWFVKNGSDNGEYVVEIIAADKAGNIVPKEIRFFADVIAPEIKVEGMNNGGFTNSSPEITTICNDNYKEQCMIEMRIYKDDKEIRTLKEQTDKLTFGDFKEEGRYEVTCKAIDAAGNESEESSVSFIYDKTAPEVGKIEFSGEKNKGYDWFKESVKIKSSAQDVLSGFSNLKVEVNGITVDNETLSDGSLETDIAALLDKKWFVENESPDGKYTAIIYATDRAGNITTEEISFCVDVIAPEIRMTGMGNGEFTNSKPEIIAISNDNYKDRCSIEIKIYKDDKEYRTIREHTAKLTFKEFEEDGKYKVICKAIDAAGNESEGKTISFIYDTESPQIGKIEFSGEKNKGYDWFKKSVKIDNNTQDVLSGLSHIKVEVNGITVANKTLSDGSLETDITALLNKDWFEENESYDGKYTVTIYATDRAGNNKTVKDAFYADVTSPKIDLSGVGDGAYMNKSPVVIADVTDNYKSQNTIYLNIDKDGRNFVDRRINGALAEYSEFNKDGRYVITVKAVDKAGNVSSVKSLTFTKDTVAPDLSLSGAKEGSFTVGAKTITAGIKERNYNNMTVSAEISKNLDGKIEHITFGKIKPTSASYTQSKKVDGTGTYTVILKAADKAGNIAKPKKLTFTIDNDKPEIEISGFAKENGYKDTVAPTAKYTDSYFKNKEISIVRTDGKAVKISYSDNDNNRGGIRTYAALKKIMENDGIYTITCTVTDKAGNTNKKSQTFAVNRFGSIYTVAPKSKVINNTYMKDLDNNIVITEKNVTGLMDQEVTLAKDGVSEIISPAVKQGEKNGWKTYTYTISKDLFADEGVYNINITSKDTVGNFSEFNKSNDKYRLYIDKTSPVITVSGIERDKSYKGKDAAASIKVLDTMKLGSYKVSYGDKELYNSDDDAKANGSNDILLPNGFNQTLKVVAYDMAGNKSMYTVENVTVSGNFIIRLISNRIFNISAIMVIVALSAIAIFMRKKKKEQ